MEPVCAPSSRRSSESRSLSTDMSRSARVRASALNLIATCWNLLTSGHRERLVQDRIKCGVIGAGWWATFAHIPALLGHPDAELIAIQKRNRAQARKVADDFGIPIACSSSSELLAIDGLQAVVVSSSPHLHYEHASAALALGKHVLIEKPMTLTVAEALDLVETAQRNEAQFLISCPW